MLLAISVAIFNIAIKEIRLSAAARESQFAFYAADTGIECALYWDIQQNGFDPLGTVSPTIDCLGGPISVTSTGGFSTSTFRIDLAPEPYCADVSVGKHNNPRLTLIEARGYNTCATGDPRRVERAIRASY
jgi:hypothetical protein